MIESTIRNWEEREIKLFASHNCYLRIDPLVTSSTNSSLFIKQKLKQQKRAFKNGEMNEAGIERARAKVHLEEEDWLYQELTRLLILANNLG